MRAVRRRAPGCALVEEQIVDVPRLLVDRLGDQQGLCGLVDEAAAALVDQDGPMRNQSYNFV